MGKRANLLVIVGLAVFLLGGAAVLMLVKDDNNTAPTATGTTDIMALFATQAIPAGTAGNDAVTSGAVEARKVSGATKAVDALGGPGELVGKVFTIDVAKGDQVRQVVVRNETLRSQAIDIPDGKQAVAVQMPFVPGVAGYVGAGDIVNVYALVGNEAAIAAASGGGDAVVTAQPKLARLLLTNVQVLDVSQEVAPRRVSTDPNVARPVGSDLVYLLAVDPVQAEQMIFTTAYESFYLTLAEKDQPPAATSGHTYDNLFQ